MIRKLLLICTLALFTTGCVPINPISPIIQLGVMWYEGEAHKYYNADSETLEKAVRETIKELDFMITKEYRKDQTLYLYVDDGTVAETPEQNNGNRFKMKVTKIRYNITKLSIRINTWGDKPYTEMFYRHVDGKPGIKQFATLMDLNEAVEAPEPKNEI